MQKLPGPQPKSITTSHSLTPIIRKKSTPAEFSHCAAFLRETGFKAWIDSRKTSVLYYSTCLSKTIFDTSSKYHSDKG